MSDRLGVFFNEGCKAPCVTYADTDITLSGEQTINSVSVVAGDRVLVTNQDTGTEDGIYVAASGAWTRAADFDADNKVVSGELVMETGSNRMFIITFSGSYQVDTTAPAIEGLAAEVPSNAATLASFGSFSDGTTQTFNKGVTISGDTTCRHRYVRLPAYSGSDAIDTAMTAAGYTVLGGMAVYCTANTKFYFYNGTNWVDWKDASTVMPT